MGWDENSHKKGNKMRIYKIDTSKIVTEDNKETLQNIYDYLADLMGVVRGKEVKDSEKLFTRLLKENLGKPSRPLEYIPMKFKGAEVLPFLEQERNFGRYDREEDEYITNAREAIEVLGYMEVGKIDFTNYHVFKIKAPYFVYGQVSTHGLLTTVCHSKRYSKSSGGYWKPREIPVSRMSWELYVENATPSQLRKYIRNFTPRREIWARGADSLEYREFAIGGYTDTHSWEHFFKLRTESGVQEETRGLVKEIQSLVYPAPIGEQPNFREPKSKFFKTLKDIEEVSERLTDTDIVDIVEMATARYLKFMHDKREGESRNNRMATGGRINNRRILPKDGASKVTSDTDIVKAIRANK